jgi:hypothetical protein
MRKFISAAIAFAMTVSAFAGMTVARAAEDGKGTAVDPYVVSTAAEWESATKTGYIQLGADIATETAQRTAGNLTLDLNGHTLSSNKAAVVEVFNNHTFTLVDTGSTKGKLINSSTGYGIKVAANNATANINGASVQSGGQGILVNGAGASLTLDQAVIDTSNIAINIAGTATAIINSGTFNGNKSYVGTTLNIAGSADVTINGGTFEYNGTASSCVISGTSNVTINGGKFYNPNRTKAAIVTDKNFNGVLNINGGTFENTNETAATSYSYMDGNEGNGTPSVIINGGIFNSAIASGKPANTKTKINITGGTFVQDPSTIAIATIDENSVVKNNGTGTWTVTAKAAPATHPAYFIFDGAVAGVTYNTVKINVTESGVQKDGSATLKTAITLEEDASIGLEITGVPDDVVIKTITLE